MTPASWFTSEILRGIQQLAVMGFERQPASELLEATAKGWVSVLWSTRDWDQGLDTQRIRDAFSTLIANSTSWPVPRQFQDALRPRPQPRALTHDITPEQREANLARLRELAQKLSNGGKDNAGS